MKEGGMTKVIVKAAKVKLTTGRIADFRCPKGKEQVFLWCDDPTGLAIRATAAGAKSYIFQAKVSGQSMRVTIGDVSVWNIVSPTAGFFVCFPLSNLPEKSIAAFFQLD